MSRPSQVLVATVFAIIVFGYLCAWATKAAALCQPAAIAFAHIAGLGGKVTAMTPEDLGRAKLFYANQPPSGPEPVASEGYFVEMPDGGAVMLFVHGKAVCDTMAMKPGPQVKALRQFVFGQAV